ncbi:MAG: hypothetical protein WBB29_01775 [Geitlerinemataceae cyanobacterium]
MSRQTSVTARLESGRSTPARHLVKLYRNSGDDPAALTYYLE